MKIMRNMSAAYRAADAWLATNLINNWAALTDQAKRSESHAKRPTGRHRARGVHRALFSWHAPTHGRPSASTETVVLTTWDVVRNRIREERRTGRLRELAWGALAA